MAHTPFNVVEKLDYQVTKMYAHDIEDDYLHAPIGEPNICIIKSFQKKTFKVKLE